MMSPIMHRKEHRISLDVTFWFQLIQNFAHNGGRLKGGAKSTAGKGPWDMVLIVHGFPNDISALRFEWAWQNPDLSRRLSNAVAPRRPKETPFEYRFRVLSCMLRIGPWNRLGLIIRWLKQEYQRNFDTDLSPPLHMPIVFGPVQLEPKRNDSSEGNWTGSCQLCNAQFKNTGSLYDDVPIRCPASCIYGSWHLMCIAEHMLTSSESTANQNPSDLLPLIPLSGTCPACHSVDLFWPHLIHQWKMKCRACSSS
ncbi:unnamed protein product [Calicophoron daubneyi]|uniref:Structure-specific endonuclease subunit SLX1 C-terminal domain-containing protein n=1 Tax=Calicophoron daubneyi TaxID=300641 RepID=A0AAV2U2T8_CALDB